MLDEEYQEFLESVPDAVIVVAAPGTIVYATSRAEILFGYRRGELGGQELAGLIPQENRSAHERAMAGFFAAGRARSMGHGRQLTGLRKDGTTFATDIVLTPVQRNGQSLVTCFIRDITERKRLEAALQERDELSRMLMENAAEVFYRARGIHPETAHVTFVSEHTERITGHSSAAIRRNPALWLQSVHPDDVGAVVASTRVILADREPGVREYRMWHAKRLEYRWVEERVIPELDGEGRVIGFAGLAHDVTDRKLHENELRVVADVSAALRQAQSRAEMPAAVLGQLQRMLRAEGVALASRSPEGRDTIIEFALGEFAPGTGLQMPPGVGLCSHVIETGVTYLNDDARRDARFSRPDLLEHAPAIACVPLIAHREVIGALLVGRVDPISERELTLLRTVAEMFANGLHKANLNERVARDAAELAEAYQTTLEGWTNALDLRDHETEGHTQRVTALTLRLATAMGFSKRELVHIRRGALLHDIGKMGVPDSILLKAGPLTDDEWRVMRMHPTYAYNLLSPIEYLRAALDIPYCHHERWDGTGYPRGLKGEEIPLTARLFAVVDVWDAMRNDRPYRAAVPIDEARTLIAKWAGTHFDPNVVSVFLELEQTMPTDDRDLAAAGMRSGPTSLDPDPEPDIR